MRSGRIGDRDRVGHHRQDAGKPDLLGEDPDAECGDELEDDRRRHVLDTIEHRNASHPSAGPTMILPATPSRNAGRDVSDGKLVRGDGSDREPIDQQRGRIVEQALAFENRQDAMRRLQLPQTAVAATASGGATTAPSAIAGPMGSPA